MPKIAHGEGATAEGLAGVVDDAQGRLWELDPERNTDGTLKDGDHPDREEREANEPTGPDDEPHLQRDEQRDETDEKSDEKEGQSSPGNSSSTSKETTPKTQSKSAPKGH